MDASIEKENLMFKSRKPTVLLLTATILSASSLAFGQSDKKQQDIVREIQIPPQSQQVGPPEEPPEQYYVKNISAPEPVPALKYRLYPSRGEMKPGNSVPFYYRALVSLNDISPEWKPLFQELREELEGKPFSEYLEPDLRKRIERLSRHNVIEHLETAAYREQTDWDWQMTELTGMEPITFMFPEIQQTRELSRLIDVMSGYEAALGNYEEAIELNKLSFKLGRDVGEPPSLIADLVGMAISSISLNNIRDMICQTDGPNLYWALAVMPDPLVPVNPGLEYEAEVPEMMFPVFRDPEHAEHTPDEWSRLLREAAVIAFEIETNPSPRTVQSEMMTAGLLVRAYPIAKRQLIAAGWEQDKILQMPVGQVVAIYQKDVMQNMYQNLLKWQYLPQLNDNEQYERSRQEISGNHPLVMREPIPLASILMPAVTQAKSAELRMQSRIKGLMVLEAIRMHAAEHSGQLPQSLEEIKVVPVPAKSPLTGEPYKYKYADGTATLLIPTQPARYGTKIWWEFHLKSE